jgi:hypothetical protein
MWNDAPDNFQPNDAGGVTLTITSANLDSPLVVDGLNKVEAEPDDDKVTLSKVDSGMTTVNRIRTTSGTLRFEVSDSSPSMTLLSQLANLPDPIAFAFTDPVTPDLNASSSYGFFKKHPMISRTAETNVTTFEVTCPVLKCKTGGFSIVVTE